MRRLALFLFACGTSPPMPDPPYVPPPESCSPANVDAFTPCTTGGGIFGEWTIDDLGAPAYDYKLDENADSRAAFANTEKLDRRDHWHQFGNARITAMLVNDGYVEITEQDRGETYLDKFEEEQGNFAGGYSAIALGDTVWSTAYKWRTLGTKTSRRFGMGYAQTSAELGNIKVTHTFVAPPGDANALVDIVDLENTSDAKKTFEHHEIWDVARRHIETDWLVSGSALPLAPANVRAKRDARNALFDEAVDFTNGVLGLRRTFRGSPPVTADAPSAIDYFPPDQFLAVLSGEVADTFTDQNSFFGAGGIAHPDRKKGAELGTRSGDGQPRIFVVKSNVTLGPHEKKTLRFAYGYAPHGQPFAIDPTWATRDLRKEIVDDQRAHSMSFASDRDPVLRREMAWHASQLESSVGWREYWGRHVVPQGSAYLFLHGADGALRDLGLFAVPLAYTHKSLAKEELLLACGMHKFDTKAFSYAFQGNGVLDDASGVHYAPSDLDLFFLWAVAEYVQATGDDAFLDESAPYWPRENTGKVRDHVHDALRHFFDVVGTGPHGLVRVGTGDWSDGIDFEAPDRDLAIAKGESVPNTEMALWVLPLAKSLEPALAMEIDMHVAALQAALPKAWAGNYFGRAYFGDDVLRYADKPNLESQVWALVGNEFANDADKQKTLDAIANQLDTPVGAALVPGGQVWPAISALLTWGWAKSDPERAWKHLAKNGLAGHAVQFPTIWYGIWSGPDGMTSTTGEAWSSLVTPMTDFPTMNANQHAMPMLAALRVLGIEPTAIGLRIAPHVPVQTIALHTELLDVKLEGNHLSGTYRPSNARKLEVVLGTKSATFDIPAGGAPFDLQ